MNVVEWTINNFSNWNGYVHEKQIECSGSGFTECPLILLYPRGLSGCEEHLVVHVYAILFNSSVLSGHFSCIDSSGSSLCTLQINEKVKKGDYYELLPKLKFTDVAAQIRKNENLHHDRFTLRCELEWNDDRAYRLYTTIGVFDSCVRIDVKKITEGCRMFISTIKFPVDEREKEMSLYVTVEYPIFFIEPEFLKKCIFVSTSMSVLNFHSVTRIEENEHVFQDTKRWQFLNSLTSEELTEEGVSLLLRIKVVPNIKYKHHYGCFTGHRKAVDFFPRNILIRSNNPEELFEKSPRTATSNKPDDSVTVLLNELMCLYQDHDFSDFQLRCGQVSIPTHKSILSARSPVFKALLQSDMREAASDSMDITDLDVHTLGRFLVFLYTGTVDDPLGWEGALKLFYAADKYQVPTLRRECFSVFRKKVSASNVCDILSLADKHQNEELTTEAHDFMLKNYNDVLRSEGWKTFINKEPLLVAKTLTYFSEKNLFKIIPDS